MTNSQSWWHPAQHEGRRPALLARNRIQRAVRGWLDDQGFTEVDPAALASRSRNSPYAGRELPGRVVATFLHGTATVLDGKATK